MNDKNSLWTLEPHCCRVCFGRIASRRDGDTTVFECTCCGLSATGTKPSVICACGIKIRKARHDGRTAQSVVDAGIRCQENPNKTPEFPSLFIASHVGGDSGF